MSDRYVWMVYSPDGDGVTYSKVCDTKEDAEEVLARRRNLSTIFNDHSVKRYRLVEAPEETE